MKFGGIQRERDSNLHVLFYMTSRGRYFFITFRPDRMVAEGMVTEGMVRKEWSRAGMVLVGMVTEGMVYCFNGLGKNGLKKLKVLLCIAFFLFWLNPYTSHIIHIIII
jgi:hypothetical protein